MFKIEESVEIQADRDRVHRALTTTDGNQGWWTKNCEFAGKPGGTARFIFDGGKMAATFRLDALCDDQVEMTCIDNVNNPDWQDTRVTYRLKEKDGATRVDLVHAGWRDKTPVYDMCVGGWTHFMGSLKAFVETGSGTPNAG